MLLKSLEIAGFKSFARKSGLAFETPITSIVGPNGSGKSNVAESFRFVLGEQSFKSMRGKKGEDLIFNGTPNVGRLNRASVKLVFDNSSKFLPMDFDEVSIERVVHRDSINEYFINGSSCRLKDIVELLGNANIGSSGHHIISQGEADRVLNASVRERREMIEDALGLNVFQSKKEESERKLTKTFENIEKVESLRREIAPHLKFLRKQVERIEKTKEVRATLVVSYREYLLREYAYLMYQRDALAQSLIEPRQRSVEIEARLKEAQEEMRIANVQSEESREIADLEVAHRDVRARIAALSHEIGLAEGEIRSFERVQEDARRKAAQEDARTLPLREVRTIAERFTSDMSLAALETMEAEDIRSWAHDFALSIQSLLTKYEGEAPQQVLSYEDDIAKLKAQQQEARAKSEVAVQEEVGIRKQLDDVRARVEAAKEGTREAEKRMLAYIAEQNELQGRITALVRDQERLALEETEYKRELTEAGILVGLEVVDFYTQYGEPLAPQFAAAISGWESEERSQQIERRRGVEKLKIRLEEMGIGSTDDVLREFNEVTERDAFLVREIADLQTSAESLKSMIAELEQKIATEFHTGIAKINTAFAEFFALMFGGGHAALKVVKEKKRTKKDTDLSALLDGEAPSTEEEDGEDGIDIAVDLPRKKIKSLIMLSGGERALTSIALLFAMSQVNPPPFIILDETDAALDEANSRKYGDMIESLSRYSQLILITHNRETMSRAGVIYGVTMGSDGVSKLLSIKFDEAVQVAK